MALSEDKKAILRLLAQRGEQGYEDLSALMGISADEVYGRAKEAGAELESEGIPAPAIPAPPGAAPVQSPPVEPPRPVSEPRQSVPVPKQSTPEAQPAPQPNGPNGPAPRQSRPQANPPALPKGERKPLRERFQLLEGRGLWAILAGVAIAVLFVVIVLTSGGGGGSGSSSTTTAATETKHGKQKELTEAILNPVDGSEATGVAIFGRVKNTLALQIAAKGLEPTGPNDAYTFWLAASPQRMLPLATTKVGKDGRINAQVEVPTEVLAYLADETFGQITVSRTLNSRLEASLKEATKAKKAPAYTGTEVLRGTVTGPIVGAAKKRS